MPKLIIDLGDDERNEALARQLAEKTPAVYKAEFTTAGDRGSYATNGLIFASREECERYALALSYRWTAVVDWRIREATPEEAASDSLATAEGLVR